jgi:hypothetical protein
MPLPLLHLCQRHLRLRQPERHVHGAIQRDGRGQLSAGLLPLAYPGIQRTQAEVAVRHEWTHAEFFRQSEGLPVVMFGRLDLRGGLRIRNTKPLFRPALPAARLCRRRLFARDEGGVPSTQRWPAAAAHSKAWRGKARSG